MATPKPVPNTALRAELIPQADAAWAEFPRFALTFDGYAAFGEVTGLAELHRRRRPDTLSELRARLFFLQRRSHHAMTEPEDADRAEFVEVFEQIRQRARLANALLA